MAAPNFISLFARFKFEKATLEINDMILFDIENTIYPFKIIDYFAFYREQVWIFKVSNRVFKITGAKGNVGINDAGIPISSPVNTSITGCRKTTVFRCPDNYNGGIIEF